MRAKIGTFAGLLLLCGSARADPVAVSLEWTTSAPDCASPEKLRQGVARLLRRNTLSAQPGSEIVVEGETKRTGPTLRADIVVKARDGRELGRRQLLAPDDSCHELDAQLLVVLAMIIDSSLVSEALATLRASPDPPRGRRRPLNGEKAAREDRFRVLLGLRVRAEAGQLPGTPVAAEFVIGVDLGWVVELGLSLWQEGEIESDAGSLTVRSAELIATGCTPGWGRRLAIAGCGGLTARLLRGEGVGFENDRSELEIALDGHAGLRLEFQISSLWSLQTGLALAVSLRRPGFVFESMSGDIVPIYRAKDVAANGRLGVVARF